MISSVVEHEDDAQTLPDTKYVCLATSPCRFKAEFLYGKKQLATQDFIVLQTEFWLMNYRCSCNGLGRCR